MAVVIIWIIYVCVCVYIYIYIYIYMCVCVCVLVTNKSTVLVCVPDRYIGSNTTQNQKHPTVLNFMHKYSKNIQILLKTINIPVPVLCNGSFCHVGLHRILENWIEFSIQTRDTRLRGSSLGESDNKPGRI